MEMWSKVKKNWLFRFLSSVKLAVPLLTVLALTVLAGTLIESRYNAEYAKLVVYESDWFIALHGLLGLNIAVAAISRIPWKRHHTGFVITHLGMIVLLIGSWMTFKDGIDGVMSVQEGQDSSSVVINERVIELGSDKFFKKMLIDRGIFSRDADDFKEINSHFAGLLSIEQYHPFVRPRTMKRHLSGKSLAFSIKSQFFNENLSMPLEGRSEQNLGPVLFRLVPYGEEGFTEKKVPSKSGSNQDLLIVRDRATGKVVREVVLSGNTSPVKMGNLTVKVVRKFKNGTVVDNKMVEGEGEGNPVLELEVLSGGKKMREILYARYPEFSMLNKENLSHTFGFVTASAPESAAASGNVVEFQLQESLESYQEKLTANRAVEVKVLLIKNEKLVSERIMKIGENFETPWMKMNLTLNALHLSESTPESTAPEVLPGPEKLSNELPPSALVVRVSGNKEPIWLVEGQFQDLMIDGVQYRAYYGKNIIHLPFGLHLDQFVKNDYLGTDTPMSYESHVRVNSGTEKIKISMNEPLKREGFTLYQSSYQLIPNAPAVSVFTVNQDPGRWVKYLGSLIMTLGIAIYALMRSRLNRLSQGQ